MAQSTTGRHTGPPLPPERRALARAIEHEIRFLEGQLYQILDGCWEPVSPDARSSLDYQEWQRQRDADDVRRMVKRGEQ